MKPIIFCIIIFIFLYITNIVIDLIRGENIVFFNTHYLWHAIIGSIIATFIFYFLSKRIKK